MTPFAQFCYLRSKFVLKINDVERETLEISGERNNENIEKIMLLYKKAMSIAAYDTERIYIERYDLYCLIEDTVLSQCKFEANAANDKQTFIRFAGYQEISVRRFIHPEMSNLPNIGDIVELTQTQPPVAL